jgi:hypothetical protein
MAAKLRVDYPNGAKKPVVAVELGAVVDPKVTIGGIAVVPGKK